MRFAEENRESVLPAVRLSSRLGMSREFAAWDAVLIDFRSPRFLRLC